VSIDGVDFEIQEPTPRWKGWYNHKHNGPGLRYEVAVSLKRGDIVWVHGPFPCGMWPDVKIFKFGLKHWLDEGERVEADDGYIGQEPMACKTPGGFSSRVEGVCGERNRLRSRHETINKRLKDFEILKQRYRHERYDHAFVFRAVAILVQLAKQNGEPLFQL